MKFYTSYFASKAPKENKVCIAKKPYRFAPKLPKAVALAPSNPWAEGDWKANYRADLDERFPTPESLMEYLKEVHALTEGTPILCCYEKNPAECHRSILAEYIAEKLGLIIEEWTQQPEQKQQPATTSPQKTPVQATLL